MLAAAGGRGRGGRTAVEGVAAVGVGAEGALEVGADCGELGVEGGGGAEADEEEGGGTVAFDWEEVVVDDRGLSGEDGERGKRGGYE